MQFQFTVTYRPGHKNTKANALSRVHALDLKPEEPEPTLPPDLFICPILWSLDKEICAAALEEPAPLGGLEGKIYMPTSQCLHLLDSLHSPPGSGHPGRQRTLSLLRNRNWLPDMTQEVA